jgi:Tol biopolymer transport system component
MLHFDAFTPYPCRISVIIEQLTIVIQGWWSVCLDYSRELRRSSGLIRALLKILFGLFTLSLLFVLTGTLIGQSLPRREWDTLAYTTLEIGRWTNTRSYLLDTRTRITRPYPHRYNAWSPDGEWLASAVWTGETVQIQVSDAFGRSPRVIADAGSRISPLSWSADGIMYVKEAARRGSTINTVSLNGVNDQSWFYTLRETRAPAWSPEGGSAVFRTVQHDQPGLFLLELRSGEMHRIVSDGYIADIAAWSPDGRWIAYTSGFRYTSEGIVVTDRRGRTRRQLSDFGSSPVWSADGTEIVFLDNRNWTFYRVEVESGDVHPFYIVPGHDARFIIANSAWRGTP